MSSATPSKRLLRTSDLTDFFRGSSSGPHSTGSSSVVFGDNQLSSSSSPSRKRSTRIPFIGRSRKKSTHSDVVPSDARESRSSVTTAGSRSILEQYTGAIASLPHASTSQQSLKTGTPSHSFGSKIAAHFTPSKSLNNLKLTRKRSTKRTEEVSGSESLAPPRSSTDSKSSQLSGQSGFPDRSSTPRASHANDYLVGSTSQPTITVSRPDDLDNLEDEYDDLFTKPRNKVKPGPTDTRPLHFASEVRSFPPLGPTFYAPPTTSVISRHPSAIVRTTVGDSAIRIASRVSKLSHDSDSIRPSISGASVASFRRLPLKPKEKLVKQHGIDSDPAEDSEAMSIKSAMSMPTSFRSTAKVTSGLGRSGILEKRRSLATSYHSKAAERSAPPSQISQPSKPPSYPLPATPSPSSSPTSSPTQSPGQRPRAHTISSGRSSSPLAQPSRPSSRVTSPLKRNNTTSRTFERSSPVSRDPTAQSQSLDRNSSSSSSSSSTPTLTKILPRSTPVEIDIDNSSADELRKALRLCMQQFDELSSQTVKITEAHTAERITWEKRLLELEREAERREKEITGLTWLVKNDQRGRASSVSNIATTQTGSRTPSLVEMERSDDSSARSSLPTPSSSIKLPLNRLLQGEDSGAESYPTSTSEWGSGASGAEDESQIATMKPRRAMRRLRLVESAYNSAPITRPIPLKQPGPGSDVSGSDVSYLLKPSKRSSVSSSFSVSSENSATSLTFPTSQTLIPIPESRAKETHSDDKDDYKRERKLSRISFKQSSGQPLASSKVLPQSKSPIDSVTPGSRLTPSEAYIRNLKKGRPPSIAQVLDLGVKADQPPKSPISSIEDSYGGRSRALLAGMDKMN